MTVLKNGVRIDTDYVQGYGGPDRYSVSVVYENRLLEEKRCSGEFHQGVTFAELQAKWGDWSAGALKLMAAKAKLASRVCDICGGDTLDGTCRSQYDLFWCDRCDKKKATTP